MLLCLFCSFGLYEIVVFYYIMCKRPSAEVVCSEAAQKDDGGVEVAIDSPLPKASPDQSPTNPSAVVVEIPTRNQCDGDHDSGVAAGFEGHLSRTTSRDPLSSNFSSSQSLRSLDEENVQGSIEVLPRSPSHAATKQRTSSSSSGFLPRRMDALEGIRFVASIHIVLFHFYTFNDKQVECLPCRLGNYWVPVFFVLTGLVSYKSCARKDTPYGGLRLLERRVKILYPIIFVSCAIAYFSKMSVGRYVGSITVQRILLLISTYTPPFSDVGILNGPLWYISALTAYWVCLPHWCCAAKRADTRGIVAMVILVYFGSLVPQIAYFGVLGLDLQKDGAHNLRGMMSFSPYSNWFHVPMGVLLAAVLDKYDGSIDNAWGRVRRLVERFGASFGVLLLALFFGLYEFKDYNDNNLVDWHHYMISGPYLYPVLFFLFVGCSKLLDPTARALKLIGRLGKYSLPIYLLHFPILGFLQTTANCPACMREGKIGERYLIWLLFPPCLTVASILGVVLQDRWSAYCTPPRPLKK